MMDTPKIAKNKSKQIPNNVPLLNHLKTSQNHFLFDELFLFGLTENSNYKFSNERNGIIILLSEFKLNKNGNPRTNAGKQVT